MKVPALWALLLAATAALSACTSSQDVLEPSALLETGTPAPANPLAQTPPTGQTAAVVTDARIQFAPVVGAGAEASAPLSARLAAQAGARGISLVQPGDQSANLVMKGYFSAISEGSETTVIYVWDVLDLAGTRVHRIQGQSKSPSGTAEGWAAVQPATMEAIADQTVDQLTAWLAARQG